MTKTITRKATTLNKSGAKSETLSIQDAAAQFGAAIIDAGKAAKAIQEEAAQKIEGLQSPLFTALQGIAVRCKATSDDKPEFMGAFAAAMGRKPSPNDHAYWLTFLALSNGVEVKDAPRNAQLYGRACDDAMRKSESRAPGR